ncbi:MAG: bifunctional 3,4-dihydroxy-2-butanone-4-phosphate synthase/GTP cyclohydrolase II [Planctomycetota bacterium]|nr:MAG: bifunctional 3,4-dihydroxy-2-butanone-4-phosphate synthase/GTP cyclohydrolase II [Planctomycetota bacterium]
MEIEFSPIPEVLEDLRRGKMVVLVDDPDRENEGDLTLAAEKVTPEAINFMIRYGRGLVCLAMDGELVDRLNLPMMVETNRSRFGTAFTVSIEAREGVTTGISAYDRAHTIRTAIADDAGPDDLVTPGHVFPLRAREGGVLVRAGQTEGSVDLCRLAGLKPAAVICEIIDDDGTMARLPRLAAFCREHDLKICTIADLIEYRRRTEKLVERIEHVKLPTDLGLFDLYLYRTTVEPGIHLALTMGGIGTEDWSPSDDETAPLVRVHSECLTGDVFGSLRCDCGSQLKLAMRMIADEGRGVLLYMRQEGRGIGLENKIHAYRLQEEGLDTVEANVKLGFKPDQRNYGLGAQILVDLGIREMRLITNNPRKLVGLGSYGLKIVERVPIEIPPCDHNLRYLKTKKEKLGHLIRIL